MSATSRAPRTPSSVLERSSGFSELEGSASTTVRRSESSPGQRWIMPTVPPPTAIEPLVQSARGWASGGWTGVATRPTSVVSTRSERQVSTWSAPVPVTWSRSASRRVPSRRSALRDGPRAPFAGSRAATSEHQVPSAPSVRKTASTSPKPDPTVQGASGRE